MRGDFHVRFCERLRVKFPLPTRYQSAEQELFSKTIAVSMYI